MLTDLTTAIIRLEGRVRRQLERQANWVWHAWYLPSSTDVRRLAGQLAALEARIRDLAERLDELEEPDRERQTSEAG